MAFERLITETDVMRIEPIGTGRTEAQWGIIIDILKSTLLRNVAPHEALLACGIVVDGTFVEVRGPNAEKYKPTSQV